MAEPAVGQRWELRRGDTRTETDELDDFGQIRAVLIVREVADEHTFRSGLSTSAASTVQRAVRISDPSNKLSQWWPLQEFVRRFKLVGAQDAERVGREGYRRSEPALTAPGAALEGDERPPSADPQVMKRRAQRIAAGARPGGAAGRLYKPKPCASCGEEFQPGGPRALYCEDCKEARSRA